VSSQTFPCKFRTLARAVFRRCYCSELATLENALFAFDPISRMVPTTRTRITASMTAYSAISCPSSSDQSLRINCDMSPSNCTKNPCKQGKERSRRTHNAVRSPACQMWKSSGKTRRISGIFNAYSTGRRSQVRSVPSAETTYRHRREAPAPDVNSKAHRLDYSAGKDQPSI
jgi:hypothetical protein